MKLQQIESKGDSVIRKQRKHTEKALGTSLVGTGDRMVNHVKAFAELKFECHS